MERVNSEGIPLDKLTLALKDRHLVMTARRVNHCLLCRHGDVNAAGLCDPCYSQLNGPSLKAAVRWLSGEGP